MAKQNTKAGATQLSQAMAAEQQAQEQKAQEQAVQEQAAGEQEQPKEEVKEEVASEQGAVQEKAPQEAPQEEAAAPVVEIKEEALIVAPVTLIPEAPVVASTVVVEEKSEPVASNASVSDQLSVILADVPAAYQIDINRVLVYIERMAPKRAIDPKAACQEQVALYKSIQNIINRQEQYFTQLFTALLYLFNAESKGALGDRYRMRFMENVALPVGDRKAFEKITQTLYILADPRSRQLALAQVNMERALENGLTVDGRNRVLEYFGL